MTPEIDSAVNLLAKGGATLLLVYFAVRVFNALEKYGIRVVEALEGIRGTTENVEQKLDRVLEREGK